MTTSDDVLASKIHVVVDTTTLHDHSAELDTASWKAILDATRRKSVDLAVPVVVLREAERQVKASSIEAQKALANAAKKLRTCSSRDTIGKFLEKQKEPIEADAAEYFTRVAAKLDANGGRILPLPDVTQEALFERAIGFVQPFKADGTGYRDALIWHSILEFLQGCPPGASIYFVSHNSKDFGSDGTLAPHLVQEASAAKGDVRLKLVPRLQDIIEILEAQARSSSTEPSQEPSGDQVEHGQVPLEFDDEKSRQLEQALVAAAENLLWTEIPLESDPDTRLALELPRAFESPILSSVELDFDSMTSQTYDVFEGDDELMRCDLNAEIELSGMVYKSEVHNLKDVHISNDDHNDHYAEVSTWRTASMVFDVLRNASGHVENCDFVEWTAVQGVAAR
ncbi:PIN domain-containing protein [Arthrobacter sp. 2MCAF14]|uniref:PIN domain-containing protein n=1 Tax=Arthrobacter sp. 2MCAF14 TaxID=3232982 RepID=UPI003F8DC841